MPVFSLTSKQVENLFYEIKEGRHTGLPLQTKNVGRNPTFTEHLVAEPTTLQTSYFVAEPTTLHNI